MDYKNILAFVIGIVILAYIILTLGTEKIVQLILQIRMEFFVLAAIVYLIHEIVASYVLKVALGGGLRIRRIVPAHMLGMLYANATPGRVGYLYTALSLAKKTGSRRSAKIGIIALSQGLNFLSKTFLCLLAVIYFSAFIPSMGSQAYLLLVSVAPIIFLIGILIALYTKIVNKIIGKLSPRFLEYLESMQAAVREVDKGRLARMLLLILLGWFIMSLQWFLVAASLGIDVGFLTVLMFQPLLTTIMFVPISPSGLGLAEGGSALLFGIVNLDPAAGAAFLLLVRFNAILVDSLGLIDVRMHNG
ncbi:MAG: flippase-like domain-containing protein [Candidatus Altiarchaeota archaeon]|nr:flippase-like domain-containing protein [Candidatus Altiarchaeota archaeon]MBU4406880.1 flippase-like domain-containing protein [Candidatus Altiarchaeota archaeon]MBU4436685.1 flippase-like domain-containing protein [Candidatus Altiarchaeota archaeon]